MIPWCCMIVVLAMMSGALLRDWFLIRYLHQEHSLSSHLHSHMSDLYKQEAGARYDAEQKLAELREVLGEPCKPSS